MLLLKILFASTGVLMVAIIIHDMTMRYFTQIFNVHLCVYIYIWQHANHAIFFFLKNVDAGAAKELMANLVSMQSSLSDVNKYVHCSLTHDLGSDQYFASCYRTQSISF